MLDAHASSVGRSAAAEELALGLKQARRQFVRFGIGGVAVAIVSVGVYWLLAVSLGIAPLLANFAQYLTNIALGFIVHNTWTFRAPVRRDRSATARYLTVSLWALGMNSAFTLVFTELLRWPPWTPVLPMVFVTPVVTFLINRHWVFAGR